ncbi:MAG: choloylglycine hydrolase [Peptostreptococcaceae bacterium]
MCTALSIRSKNGNSYFGRNMDLEYYFNQSVLIIPKKYEFEDKVTGNILKTNYAIIGMGTVIENRPAMADGMNEKGLACAGLNFAGYAYYEKEIAPAKTNVAPYDFIYWVLANHETIEEVKEAIKNIEIVDVPINEKTPVPTLHWMIVDKTGKSIVVEKTKEKLAVYDNLVGVMTNNPTFDWHLTNLNEYLYLQPEQRENVKWGEQELKPLGVGTGLLGIPGDYGSVSRFVRIAYIRNNMTPIEKEINYVTQFFHMLDYVKMVKGGAFTKEGMLDLTIYSSCMDQEKGIYYYKDYENNRINAVDIHKENLESDQLKLFTYSSEQDIKYQN